MRIWELSVKRPIFMSCIVVAVIVVGIFSFKKIPIDLFPDVSFPIVTVNTIYPGAGPEEIESLVSKPIEEQMSTIAGIKNIRSINRESLSVVVAEFNLDMDIAFAEQQVRDKVSAVRRQLPEAAEESVISRVDPSAQPIMVIAIETGMKDGELYDLANEVLKPQFEQVKQVGKVEILGVRKKEIQVQLDRNKINAREISVSQVNQALANAGQNIPAGKFNQPDSEVVFRTLGEFSTLDQIRQSIVSFFGNDVTTRVSDVGVVVESLEDERLRTFINQKPAALMYIYKQSGANTIQVASLIQNKVDKINRESGEAQFKLSVARDMSRFVWANVFDVTESIVIGIFLTVLVVFFFLGSGRSTFITGLAIPVSLIGSFTFLYLFGISINVMSLLAFSLAVGLLIDDAIVVRENIFRHMEMGKSAYRAALDGTAEVGVAVVAVTLAVLAVFGPIAFLSGVVGQFFKAFGLGVCFVMILSLFDALTNAPMMSAYFGGHHESLSGKIPKWSSPVKAMLIYFDRFQAWLEKHYENLVRWVLDHPLKTLVGTLVVVFGLAYSVNFIPKTFLPANDNGEFQVAFELAPGTTLDKMSELALQVEAEIRKNPTVSLTIVSVGTTVGQSFLGDVYVRLTPFGDRSQTTTEVKEEIRTVMQKQFAFAKPKVKDVDFIGAGQRPFVVNILGQDLEQIKTVGATLFEKLKVHPGLVDPEFSDKPGLPEFQVQVDNRKAQSYGVTTSQIGIELRGQVEGFTPAQFRTEGKEYDVRVRLLEPQRDLEKSFSQVKVPNLNFRLVNLSDVAVGKTVVGAATINRENRGRYVSIEADVAPSGPGMGGVISDINSWFKNGEIPLPEGVSYRFVGQAENFQELGQSVVIAGMLGVIFIFLVLASLYESIVTPFAIMLVIPLAVFGGFFGLFVMQSSLDLFSMIGSIMLMGLATKNSIILVDYINQQLQAGEELKKAILVACKTRLRPILMTSFALIAGMIPVAIGLNEASSQRKSLGIAVVGGVFISTLLTLIVIPAVFSYIERGRRWMIANVGKKMITQSEDTE